MRRQRCMVQILDSPPRFVERCGVRASMFSKRNTRIYGSKREAKRVLAEWLENWPNAKIVPEVSL